MNKVKVLCLSLWFPLTMSRYFEKAMRHNPNIDLKTVGPYTGSWIPWMGGMNVPEKYAKPPEIALDLPPNVGRIPYALVKPKLGDWTPDIVLCIDAGITWTAKPSDGISVTIATDPHVLDYSFQRTISDKFFNMQLCYSEPNDIYLPYAYSQYDHYKVDGTEKDIDAVLVGLQYTHVPRVEWIEELRKHGVSVFTENGPVFDEYREIANRARIGLNWPTMNDLNARSFENPAFGLASVMKRVPDIGLFLEDGVDYLGFDTLSEAIEKVLFLKNNPDEIERISQNGYKKVQPHTYDARISQMLQECGYV